MTLFYSPSTGGFYDDEVHAPARIPEDATRVSSARHAELIDAQASEAPVAIVASARGTPGMSRDRSLSDAERRDRAGLLVARERDRRITAVASAQQQLLDMRLGGPDAEARFAAIAALRDRAAAIIEQVEDLAGDALAAFDPADDTHWEST